MSWGVVKWQVRKKNQQITFQQVTLLLQNKQYRDCGALLASQMNRSIFLEDLSDIDNPVLQKVSATATKLQDDVGKKLGKVVEALLFIETQNKEIVQKQTYFFPKDETNLAFDIEYDPETKLTFIDLGEKIGRGKKKRVTKAIALSADSVKIVAKAVQSSSMRHELKVTQKMQGHPGIFEVIAVCERQEDDTHKTTLYSKLYSPGSFRKVLDDGIPFSFKEKLKISHDILTGLEQLHTNHLAHRDLSAKNYFIDISHVREGARKIETCIADLGRCSHIKRIAHSKVQGNSTFVSPEGILRSSMEGKDYLGADVWAVGNLFWRLFYGAMPPWRSSQYVKDASIELTVRQKMLIDRIEASIRPRQKQLILQAREALSPKDEFEALILRMCDPNPEARGTAGELRMAVEGILKRV